jgi:hypothetical protein
MLAGENRPYSPNPGKPMQKLTAPLLAARAAAAYLLRVVAYAAGLVLLAAGLVVVGLPWKLAAAIAPPPPPAASPAGYPAWVLAAFSRLRSVAAPPPVPAEPTQHAAAPADAGAVDAAAG